MARAQQVWTIGAGPVVAIAQCRASTALTASESAQMELWWFMRLAGSPVTRLSTKTLDRAASCRAVGARSTRLARSPTVGVFGGIAQVEFSVANALSNMRGAFARSVALMVALRVALPAEGGIFIGLVLPRRTGPAGDSLHCQRKLAWWAAVTLICTMPSLKHPRVAVKARDTLERILSRRATVCC